MPYGDPHHAQKRKNVTLLLILMALVGLMYAITMMRLGA